MFGRFFNLEAPFWVGVAKVADLVWLNILFVVTSLPVITMGAAFVALYDTAWRQGEGMGSSVTKQYFRSMRINFGKATLLWLVVGPIGALLVFSWVYLPVRELLVMKSLLSLVYLLIFPYVWFLQARFENPVWRTLKNSVLIPIGRLPFATGVLLIDAALLALTILTTYLFPQVLPLILLVGFALPPAATMPLLNRTVSPWINGPTS